MITRFGALATGNVDMENEGLDGTPVNDRLFSDEQLFTGFHKTQRIAELMDRVGYDTLWLAEHHFQKEGYEVIPNILLFSLHLAHLTEKLKFGCGFNINPMWHPLRLAEDFATVDHLTGGRVIFGLGRGYHSREVNTFGVPSTQSDNDANREMFEEGVDIIFKAFNNQSFSHQGKYYTIPARVPYRGYTVEEITLVPRPRTHTRRDLAAHGKRQPAGLGLHGKTRYQGPDGRRSGEPSWPQLRYRGTLARNPGTGRERD